MSKRSPNNNVRSYDTYSKSSKKSSKHNDLADRMDPIASICEVIDRPREVRSKRSVIVKCPLCLDDFPSSEIERHASMCLELNELITNPKNAAKAKNEKPHRSVMRDSEVSSKKDSISKHSFVNGKKYTKEKRPHHSLSAKKSNTIHDRINPEDDGANSLDIVNKKVGSNKAKKTTRRKSIDSNKSFKIENFPELKQRSFSRALTPSEQPSMHVLDLKIQHKFPSTIVSKSKKNAAIVPCRVSEKPFASVNDARRFLFLLENFVSSRSSSTGKKKNILESSITSSLVLSYIKMAKEFMEAKITLPQFINGFLLLFVKELLTDIESRISKAIEILRMFNSFLPNSQHLVNEFPEICELLIMSDAACSKFDQFFTKQKLNQFCKKIQSLG